MGGIVNAITNKIEMEVKEIYVCEWRGMVFHGSVERIKAMLTAAIAEEEAIRDNLNGTARGKMAINWLWQRELSIGFEWKLAKDVTPHKGIAELRPFKAADLFL